MEKSVPEVGLAYIHT